MPDKKHFDKTLPPSCAYCRHGRTISGGKEIFCLKEGLKNPADSCRSYRYDVLKRSPSVKDIGRDYKPEDFKI